MITEKEREAIMRLTMCARRNCAICIYGHDRKRTTVKLPQSCLDRITENMNILAAACDDKNEPKRGEWIHGREIWKEWAYDHWIIYYEDWHCSNCKVVFEQDEKPKYNYCPNCGAKMEAEA